MEDLAVIQPKVYEVEDDNIIVLGNKPQGTALQGIVEPILHTRKLIM